MKPAPVVILGCGYTGRRVAVRLVRRGVPVVATTRNPALLDISGVQTVAFEAAAAPDLSFVPEGARVLYSMPPTEPDYTRAILSALAGRATRVVYISTTGVYGAAEDVNETTPVAPVRPQEVARVHAEQEVLSGPWSGLVLRAPAIYGPERGIHVSMQRGTFRMAGEGANFVSRIHVDDLAAHCEAALDSDLTGAWPLGDDRPCRTLEIAEFCAHLLGLEMPPSADPETLHHTRQANRRVDGSAIRRKLGISLEFPSYVEGIVRATGKDEHK